MPDNKPIIEVDGLVKIFGNPRTGHPALGGVNLAVGSQTRMGIVGESGSGKSTLSRIIAGLDRPTRGSVTFRGREISSMIPSEMRDFRREVQLIAQDTSSSFDPRRTLRDSIRRPAQLLLGADKRRADHLVDETLALVGLAPQLADRMPGQVSGGQRQRFCIVRALVVKPTLILCDEVVSALDVSVQGTVLNFLKNYCLSRGAGLLFVSHGLPATAFVSNQIVVMKDGLLVEEGPVMQVLHHSQHPYTRSLVDAYRVSARPGGTGAGQPSGTISASVSPRKRAAEAV
jgi:ABC-type glutathione transport system ATPase component